MLDEHLKEKINRSRLDEKTTKKVKVKLKDFLEKYQRQKTKNIILFICTYLVFKEDEKEVTLRGIADCLNLDHKYITLAIKYARETKKCIIEEVSMETVAKSVLKKLSIKNITIENVMIYYEKLKTLSNIHETRRPLSIIAAIVYQLISPDGKFDKMYYTDKVGISIVILDVVIREIRFIFEN